MALITSALFSASAMAEYNPGKQGLAFSMSNNNWVNQPTELNWLVSVGGQFNSDAQFYDLSLAMPIAGNLNKVNELSLLFINRLVYGQFADSYFTWDGEHDDYYSIETAFRMNFPISNQLHLFAEGGLDSGQLFGRLFSVNVYNNRKFEYDNDKFDYSFALGAGYTQANYSLNLITRVRQLHFNQKRSETFAGVELVYGF